MLLLFLLLLLLQLLPAEPPTTTVIQSGAVQCSAVGATSCCIKTSHKNKDWSTKTAVALPLQYPPQTGEPVWGREPVWVYNLHLQGQFSSGADDKGTSPIPGHELGPVQQLHCWYEER